MSSVLVKMDLSKTSTGTLNRAARAITPAEGLLVNSNATRTDGWS